MISTNEIVESTEEIDSESKFDEKAGRHRARKSGNKYIEDDINRLFESIEIRTPRRGFGQSCEGSKDAYRKSALKRPIRAGSSQVSGIGISENVSLKQALRGLCISQASEMAAMKRLSKPGASPGVAEAGTIKRLYRTVVVEANGSGIPSNEDKLNFVEVSLVPEKVTMDSSKSQISKADLSDLSAHPSTSADTTTQGTMMTRLQSQVLLPTDDESEILTAEVNKLKLVNPSSSHTSERVQVVDALPPTSIEVPSKNPIPDRGQKGKLHPTCSLSSCSISGVSKPSTSSPCSIKPVFGSKKFVKKKVSLDSTSASSSTASCNQKVDKDSCHSVSNLVSQKHLKTERKEILKASPVSSGASLKTVVKSRIMDTGSSKQVLSSNCKNGIRPAVTKGDRKSRSREKAEFSQSSKSSIGDYSSGTSISEESSLSGSSRSGNRPHMSKDLRWEAIHHVQKQHGNIDIRHFKLLKKLGCGDIGTVYLTELTGTHCLFALKVMDNEFLVSRKKLPRAQTEREIMQMLDHPFLPTLYTHFATDKLSCLVMEYCPGGDLHVLRQKQPCRSFSEHATRFYVAEVLLALEYLHMLGVVYRDLKPENILVREDGHIMLTDFDLSLKCGAVNPTLLKSDSPVEDTTEKMSSPCTEASCIQPFCLQPSWQVPCFTPRLLSVAGKSRKMKSDLASQVSPLPQLVVEPTSARSNSFVGTHEYLAPEIIKGEGHGNAVDWWTLGIFLFELLYGKTPFKGSANEETLANVVSRSLKFPSSPIVSFHARDLIRGLLIKEPGSRLGSVKGAAEIKQHPFFEGLNWALIRCAVPPELPKFCDVGIGAPVTSSMKKVGTKFREFESTEEKVEFELF